MRCCWATTTIGKLIYAGRTGTGFTQKTRRMLRNQLEALEERRRPLRSPRPRPAGSDLGEAGAGGAGSVRDVDGGQPGAAGGFLGLAKTSRRLRFAARSQGCADPKSAGASIVSREAARQRPLQRDDGVKKSHG